MAWIEVHDTISGHRKTYRLASNLGIPQYSAVGILISLWTWALSNAEDGSLFGFPSNAIARACYWDGDPDALVDALTESGWIDEDSALHDWYDYAGRLIEFRKKERTRLKEYRSRTKQDRTSTVYSTNNVEYTATVPNRTVPNQTKPQPLLSDADADAIADGLNAVFDKARYVGFKCTQQELDALNLMVADYGKDAVLLALSKAGEASAPKIGYIKGIFKNDPTGGTKQKQADKPKGKTVIEQQYNQRDYTPEQAKQYTELTPEEIAEAKKYET